MPYNNSSDRNNRRGAKPYGGDRIPERDERSRRYGGDFPKKGQNPRKYSADFPEKRQNGPDRGRRFGESRRDGDRFPESRRNDRRFESRIPEKPRFEAKNRQERPPRPTFEDNNPFGDVRTDPLARLMSETNAEPAQDNILAGRNPIREALKAGRDLEKLMVAKGELSGSAREIVAKAHEAGVVVQEVDRSRLDAIYPGHQGLIAIASAASYAQLDDIFAAAEEKDEDPFIVVLDGITDPHNLGAVIRTAECAGAHGVIIPERRSVGLTPAAVKASAGACEYMKVARVTNINRALEELKERGVWVIGATMDGDDAFSADLKGPVALVIGAEGEGIAPLTLKNCDMKLSLPMAGHIDSLNASVAAGILMYAVVNARRG